MLTRRNFLMHSCLTSAFVAAGPRYSLATQTLAPLAGQALLDEYFRRMAKWCGVVKEALDKGPNARLAELEAQKGWYHFPYSVLPAALLYKRQSRANHLFAQPDALKLALQIGDLLVREDKAGVFSPRLDSYRDVYMWVEAYGLLKDELGPARSAAWGTVLERNVALLVPELTAWKDVASYTENFLGTSPNHFAWWAATVLVGGIHLQKAEWVKLASGVLHRFAATEQNPDGYWGEHNPNSPTGGYNYLTTLAVGVYWEHTKDPRALEALRRATHFHAATTYGDGNLIEVFNDRNRYWEVSPWGHFAFSHFPEGRAYAQLLIRNIPDDAIDLDTLGLLGQNAFYYHVGPVVHCPPELPAYSFRIASPAGVRKQGPWTVALSGIVDTPLPRSQWFLDRQSNISLFHQQAGLILCGANSKHQPELATFSEELADGWEMTSRGGRLEQRESGDTLAVAHNSFSAEIFVPPPAANAAGVEFRINGRGSVPRDAYLGLQLRFKPGTTVTTAAGKTVVVSSEPIQFNDQDLGGELHHGAWTLKIDRDATLQWPIFPYNPYRNGPETKLENAIALLRVPLNLKADPDRWLQVNEQIIRISISIN